MRRIKRQAHDRMMLPLAAIPLSPSTTLLNHGSPRWVHSRRDLRRWRALSRRLEAVRSLRNGGPVCTARWPRRWRAPRRSRGRMRRRGRRIWVWCPPRLANRHVAGCGMAWRPRRCTPAVRRFPSRTSCAAKVLGFVQMTDAMY
jgi:hypothetical protein